MGKTTLIATSGASPPRRALPTQDKTSFVELSQDGALLLTVEGKDAHEGPQRLRAWKTAGGEPAGPAITLPEPVLFTRFTHDGQVFVITGEGSSRLRREGRAQVLGRADGPASE